MQTTSRAQHLCTLCQELRRSIVEGPRLDDEAKAHGLEILKQLRADPYTTLHTQERLARLASSLERWFSGIAKEPAREAFETRESMLLELAHIETEQRLRSWLIDITK